MTDTSQKATSQTAAILAHLRQHGSIDMPTALREYGCAALRSRISDLRRQGVSIETKMQPFVSMFGHGGRFGVYYLTEASTLCKVYAALAWMQSYLDL